LSGLVCVFSFFGSAVSVLDPLFGIWSSLTASDVAWVLAGALAGGLVNGLTGFGTGVSALPFWVNAVEPAIAAQMAAGSAVSSQLSTLRAIWPAIRWRALLPLISAGLIGIPVGLLIQPLINGHTFKIVIGIITCIYAIVMLSAGGRLRISVESRTAEFAIGFLSGIMGAIAGISGVLPTMWAALNDWPKERRRSMFQAFNLTILLAMLVASYFADRLGSKFASLLILAIPGSLLGAYIGSTIYARVDNRRFDRIVLLLLFFGGVGMIGDWHQVASYFGTFARQ
jgi:uncharacterized protein